MFVQPKACPTPDCSAHTAPEGRWWRKQGYYKVRHNHQRIPRYQCKHCGRMFSATEDQPKAGQHRPDLNAQLFRLLVSGVNARRAGIILGCTRGTVDRKIRHLVKEAQAHHARFLAGLQTSYVMMDELVTFIHARSQPVSVAVVVRVKTGEVVSFMVCRLSSKAPVNGRWALDDRGHNIPVLLARLPPVLRANATLATDAEPSYPKWIRRALPGVRHEVHKALVSKLAQKSRQRDPLFAINLTFAKMRNDLARLGRKTWTTSKTLEGLERHVWLWVAWTNKYSLK